MVNMRLDYSQNGKEGEAAPLGLGRIWDPDAFPLTKGLAHWEWDIPGNTVHFSREWQHMLQSRDASVLGPSTAPWWGQVHEDDVRPFLAMARDIGQGRVDQYETLFRVRRGDGSWVWFFSKGTVTKRHEGKAVLISGSIMDVSELRSDVKFQHGCQESRNEDAMLVYSPDLIVRMDEKLTPLFTNPRIARYLTRANRIGENGSLNPGENSGIDQGQIQFLQDNVWKVFASGFSVREKVTFPTAYGHGVTGEYSFWPEFDSEGKVVAVLTQFRDLTDQILAERRAKLNEMRLEALYRLSQMDSAIHTQVLDFVLESLIRLTESETGFLFFPHADPRGPGQVVWSRDLTASIGFSKLPQKQLPHYLLNLLSCKKNTIRRLLTNGSGVYPLLRLFDGDLSIIRFISAPVLDRGRIVCIAGVFNKDTRYEESDLQQLEAFINSAWHIVRRHRLIYALQQAKESAELANKELKLAKESAESANKVKDNFLANVSHELRTPLNGVLSMLQLLDPSPLSDQQREYLDTAKISSRALLRIISDILDISLIEANKFVLHTDEMDFRSTVSSSLDIFRYEQSRKSLEFSLDMDDAIPAYIIGDDARLRQVIFNVVGNALKFTDHGTIAVNCSLLPPQKKGEVRVLFTVRDTGIGIPKEVQESIFDAFMQVDSSSTKKHAGTGLGLTIVKRIAEIAGGSVEIESQIGVGTTVRCTLCFTEAPGATPQAEVTEAHPTDAPTRSMDVLVAEDDPTSRFALARFLQRLGHRPVCVHNGRQALEALQLHNFDCIFTDIQMPNMDGLELVRRIRDARLDDIIPTDETRVLLHEGIPGEYDNTIQVDPAVPVVSVTAHAMSGDKDRFLSLGMNHYLSKPILLKDLHSILHQIVNEIAS